MVNKMEALCCEDGWWKHLSEAQYKSDETRRNGEEFDTGAAYLESLEAAGERFDANEYFTVLTHLALEDGYVLDYVYCAPGGGMGRPICTRCEKVNRHLRIIQRIKVLALRII